MVKLITMVKYVKFLSTVFLIITIAVIFFITSSNNKKQLALLDAKVSALERNISEKSLPEPSQNPTSYYASAMQVGGIGSYLVSERVFEPDSNGYLNSEIWMNTYVNRSGDVMQVSCRNGYQAVEATSLSRNHISRTDNTTFGIQLEDKIKNHIVVTCEQE